ncbi:MAG: hypothetical protein KGJ02_02635 [Verrucomicrobiota bacterium]|nr:hypothetical protein [Verrucomicrobiota bacterium]
MIPPIQASSPSPSEIDVLRNIADRWEIDPHHVLPLEVLQELIPLVENYLNACIAKDNDRALDGADLLGNFMYQHRNSKFQGRHFLTLFPVRFSLPNNRKTYVPLAVHVQTPLRSKL